MVLVGLLVVRETVSQALGIPLGSVSVMMLAGWIVCGPQRHLGRLPGTWGHHRLPPLADTSWAALQRRDQEPGPTPLIGLRAGCNGLIALLLGLLAV
jgi:hypothetical protein